MMNPIMACKVCGGSKERVEQVGDKLYGLRYTFCSTKFSVQPPSESELYICGDCMQALAGLHNRIKEAQT